MKTVTKLLFWFIPVTLFIGVTACDSKDEPDDVNNERTGGDSGSGSENTYPYYSQFGIPSSEDNLAEALAFPGAEGGGMYVKGGRGGTVYHVTTLEDANTYGTLRYGLVTLSGPRIIVFDVGGTIRLHSEIDIRNGDLTVLGQTAPGDGITLSHDTVNIKPGTDNVIFRFVRFRVSDYDANTDLDSGSDGFWGRWCSNIIIDHCTMSWSVDECASWYGNQNFTMQWCMVSEALNNSKFHDKDGHSYGGIWGGKNASFHHNLLAHNYSRNARIDHPGIYNDGAYLSTHRGNVDYRNNVIYNWDDNNTYGGEDGWFNIVGNYYKPGPASAAKDRQWIVDAYWDNGEDYSGVNRSTKYPELYVSGNYKTDGWSSDYDATNGVYYHSQSSSYGNDPSYSQLTSPLSIKADDSKTCYVTTHTAENAYSVVLDYAGASLVRDEVDTRVVSETRNGTSSLGTNGIIATMVDTDYFPTLDGGTAEVDTDKDGIPDWFEEQFGLDSSKDDSAGYDLDKYGRYTNIEMYAHYLVKDIVANQTKNGTYAALD